MSVPRVKSPALFLLAFFVLAICGQAMAQSGTGSGSFGTVAIGQTSPTLPVTLTFSSAGTLATQRALTDGAEKLDFKIVSGGSCSTGQSYPAGGSCTVLVTFAPVYPGLRRGAVVLEDASGDALAGSYVYGAGSGPEAGFQALTMPLVILSKLGIVTDKGIAVDGNGNLFVSSVNATTTKESVVEIPAGCTQASCLKQLPGVYYAVWGLALDGAGNLWVGDWGANGTVTEIMAAGGYRTLKTHSGDFGSQIGVAVDGSGNVYFISARAGYADSVVELTAASGYTTARTLAANINIPGGVAVDANGNVFYTDQWVSGIQEIVAVNGSIPATPTINTVAKGLKGPLYLAVDGGGNLIVTANGGFIYEVVADGGYATVSLYSNQLTGPTGVAVDGGGNLYVNNYQPGNLDWGIAATGDVCEIARSSAPSLTFGTTTAPGEFDTGDGPQKVSLENQGNEPLALAGLALSSGNFTLDQATNTCTSTTMLAPGEGCMISLLFTPKVTGNPITGTLTLTDNSLNGVAVQQSLALTGSSLYTPTIRITSNAPLSGNSWLIVRSQDLSLTITINGGSGNPTPTGSVQVSATGYSGSPVMLSNGSATLTIPAGSLNLGQDTFTVQYQPDTAGGASYVPVQGQGTVMVTNTLMNLPLISVTPAVLSISVGQALTVVVAVSPANGAPTPTGTVTLASGNYRSPAILVVGGSASFTIPANSLLIGTDLLIANYAPDSASSTIYIAARGTGFVLVNAAPPPAGAAAADFGSLAIGKTSAVTPVTLRFPAGATPASLIATTQGAKGLDFAIVSGGSCGVGLNVAAGQSCTVNVTFTPGFAGLRSGAVVAQDADGQMLAMTYIHGIGIGAKLNITASPSYWVQIQNQYPPSFVPSSTTELSDGFARPIVAVDGAGNVYVADWGNNRVQKIPAGCTQASCSVTVMSGLYAPSAVAVDGAGNLFVTEAGVGDVKKIPPGCQSTSCMQTIGVGFNQPYGLMVDASGNVFVADTYNNAIKEVVAADGYATINTLATGLDLPWSVVVNAAGDLFVAEGGDQCHQWIPGSCDVINTSVVQIPAAGGYKTVNTLASGIFGKPLGLAIDGAGNLYESDFGNGCSYEWTAGSGYATTERWCTSFFFLGSEELGVENNGDLIFGDVISGKVYQMEYNTQPAIRFRTATAKGATDNQDGTQSIFLMNNGNASFTLSGITLSDPSIRLNSTYTTCSISKPIPAGGTCFVAVDFAPIATGPHNSTLTLTGNDTNRSITQVIPITAVALPPAPVILTYPANPTTTNSANFTFSDTQSPITFVCSIDGLPFATCISPLTYPALSGGAHGFQVKAVDSNGNLSLPAVYNWTVNSVGPPAPVITSAPAAITFDTAAAFSFTDTKAGVTFLCSLDGAPFATCTSGVSYTVPALTGYTVFAWHSFAVEAKDDAGNVSPETTLTWMLRSTAWAITADPVNFGALPVGQTSTAKAVTFTFTASDTIATIDATTMGITGLDFAVTDPGTCAVNTAVSKGSTCTLHATFSPKFSGQRKGGVVLLNSSGIGIGAAYLQGVGTAPQLTFTPYSTEYFNVLPPQNNADPGKNLATWVTDAAVDGAGNIYITDGEIGSVDGTVSVSVGSLWEFPVGCTTAACIQLISTEEGASGQQSTSAGLLLPNSLVMDGTGMLWGTNFSMAPFVFPTVGNWKLPSGAWYAVECFLPWVATSGIYPRASAVDGTGVSSFVANGMLAVCGSQVGVAGAGAAVRAPSPAAVNEQPQAVGGGSNSPSFDFSTNTLGLTVDPQGNLFVSDTGNNAVKEVLASSNYTISRVVGSGFNNPAGLASDINGNIYVADVGSNTLKEIVAASGYTQVLTIATFDSKSSDFGGFLDGYANNFTVDTLGNVYLANQTNTLKNQLVKLDFADPPALTFATATQAGTTDTTDGTLTVTVKNNGNIPLVISGLAVSNVNFLIDAGATTCSASTPLAAGASCTIGVLFTPTTAGALTGTLTLTDNALNATGATQQFALSGTAFSTPTTSTPTVAVTPTPASITTAQTDLVTVTVTGPSGGPVPTGSVSFFGGNYTAVSGQLSGGSATFTIPAGVLAVGSTTLNAIYTPDKASSATYAASAGSATISVTAVPASTPVVTVTPAAIDISTQQSLAVTIAVGGGSGNPTPTGSVTLSGGNYSSLAATLSNAAATITIPAGYLPAGAITLTAYYTPDPVGQANYTSASGTGLVSVEAAAKVTPTVRVTPATADILSNQPLQVTMQVSGGSGHSTPTGTVVLSSGAYLSAPALLSQGSVIVSIPARTLAIGNDVLTASYAPDNASRLTFNSAVGSSGVTVNSALVATTTILQVNATSVAFGASVTFSVAVSPVSGTGIPTGSVTLMDATSTLTTLALNASGVASYSTTSLSVGTHSITAVYGGDSDDNPSTSASVTVTVAAPLMPTTTTLQASTTSITAGASLSLTATVVQTVAPAYRAAAEPHAVPTGTVAFLDGTTTLGTSSLNASGVATFSTTALAAGGYSIIATYSGDNSDAPSTSAALTVTVAAAVPAASLTPSSLSFAAVSGTTSAGQAITLTNTGNTVLSIYGISIGGTNASAFTQSNTCGAALDVGSNCAISVTFTPASAASFSASLSVTDNAADSPQTVALSGSGTPLPSFTIGATTSAQSVKAGGVAGYTITVTPRNGAFNDAVTFSATGLPPGATASFSPVSVTPRSAVATTQMSIQTTATAAQNNRGPWWPLAGPALALIGILFLPRRRRRVWLEFCVLFLASLGALTLNGCGGGFALRNPATTYTITVFGASGNDTQSTTVQLTVE